MKIRLSLILAAALSLSGIQANAASIIGALPNTISNGQALDATPIMANYNWIVNQTNANAAGLANPNAFTAVQSGVAANSAAAFPIVSQIQANAFTWAGVAGGTANAITLTPSVSIAAYQAGQTFIFQAGAASNSGATTVSISGLATISVQVNGVACVGGEIQANKWYSLLVDASGTTAQLAPYSFSFTGGAGLQVHGTNTNDNAASGYKGEYVESIVLVGSAVSAAASNNYFDVTSITLSAGDWDISALLVFNLNGATVSVFYGGIGTVTGNSSTGAIEGDTAGYSALATGAMNDSCLTIPPKRVSLSTTTTYYLKAVSAYSAGTPKMFGRISARRVR